MAASITDAATTDAARKEEKVTRRLGMRTSCDDCGQRKRKCDGGTPCRRCFRAGRKCTYSKRKWHQCPSLRADPARKPDEEVVAVQSAPSALTTTFKRCRLSASPATGLVGMQENVFLSDFFGCVGFLPLTNQSDIRGTIVHLLANPSNRPSPASSHLLGENNEHDYAVAEESFGAGVRNQHHLSMNLPTCVFWCAVAMGALVKGRPLQSVENYAALAKDALQGYTGPPNVQVAKAWTMLGYLHAFMGDMAKYNEYLDLSSDFLAASVKQGSADLLPVGFAEVIMQSDADKMCSGDLDLGEMASLVRSQNDEVPQIQTQGVADEGEFFRYMAQASMAFGYAAFSKALEKTAEISGGCEGEEEGEGDDEPCEQDAESSHRDCSHRATLAVETIAEAMATGFREGDVDFEYMEQVSQRQTIGVGLGSLNLNGVLFLREAARGGDHLVMLERISRCVEVYERYPGVCRCQVKWFHLPHSIVATLAAVDDARARELYNRMRAVYNSSRLPETRPIPPLEEWTGISSLCQDFQCRMLDGIISNEALFGSSTPDGLEQPQSEEEKSVEFGRHDEEEALSARILPEEAIHPASVALSTSRVVEHQETTSGCYLSQESVPQIHSSSSIAKHHKYPCGMSETVFDAATESSEPSVVYDLGGFAEVGVSKASVLSLGPSEMKLPTVDSSDGDIAAADWLDITFAMLERVNSVEPAST